MGDLIVGDIVEELRAGKDWCDGPIKVRAAYEISRLERELKLADRKLDVCLDALTYLSDESRYDKTVTAVAQAALA